MWHRRLIVGVAVLCIVCFAAAVPASAKAAAKQVPDSNGTVRYMGGLSVGINQDPHLTPIGLNGWNAFALLYDRLLQLTPDSKSLAPMLATSYEWDSTNTVLTFHLRKDVAFLDGSPFNADIAVKNIQAAAATGSNAQALLATMVSVTAADPYTMKLVFAVPSPGVVYAFQGHAGTMVSAAGLANPTLLKTQGNFGISPFRFAGVDATLTYKFDRADKYWDKSHVYPAHVVMANTTDPNTTVNAVRTGVSDVALITTALLPTIKDDKNLQTVDYQSYGLQGVFLNNTHKPLDNPQVRQAINLGLDREAWNQANNGKCQPMGQSLLPGMDGYDPSLKPKTDIAKAKKLIQDAGASGAKLSMVGLPNEPFHTWAVLAQSQLQAIGLNVDLQIQPGTIYRAFYQSGAVDMLVASPIVTALEPSLVVDQYVLGVANPGTKDPALVDKIRAAEQLALGTKERNAAFQDVNRELTNKYMFWVSGCLPIYTYVGNKNLMGMDKMQYGFAGVPVLNQLQIAKTK